MSQIADDRCVLSDELFVLVEGGGYRRATPDEVVRRARLELNLRVQRSVLMDSPRVVKDYLIVRLGQLEHEVFAVMFLDSQNRLIEYCEMFRGTVAQTSVYPREIVKESLVRNAASVLLAHNHPSGAAEPSRADEYLTSTLKTALALIDVRVLDHIVVAGGATVSFAERGLL